MYGPEVETTVQEEDTQPITEPIVAPVKVVKFKVPEDKYPGTTYSKEYTLAFLICYVLTPPQDFCST